MIKLKFLLVISCIFVSFLKLESQNTIVDSLQQKSYEELADLFYNHFNDTLQAKKYAKAYFLKAKRNNNFLEIIDAKYFQSQINNNQFQSYYSFCDSLIKVAQRKNDIQLEMKIRCKKGEKLFYSNNTVKLLNEFIEIDKLLKFKKNDSIQSIVNVFKGLSYGAKKDYKKGIHYLKNVFNKFNDSTNIKDNNIFLSIPLNIANYYNLLNKKDSAIIFLKKAENIYRSFNDEAYLGATLYVRARLEYDKKNYAAAIGYMKEHIPTAIKELNDNQTLKAFSQLGIYYEKNNSPLLALKYHKKADSLFALKSINSLFIEESLNFLIQYYQKENDLKNQLNYINKLLRVKENRYSEDKKISESLINKYDKPKLIAEKNAILEKLKTREQRSKTNVFIFLSTLVVILLLLGYQIKRKRTYKKRFLRIVNSKRNSQQSTTKNIEQPKAKALQLSDKIVEDILEQLHTFETTNEFVNPDINLKNLALHFGTNSNYLSKVVNHHKKLTFTNYINKLRIEYTVERLQNDDIWRKYTVKALAQEVGFKNTESFSKAFQKYTGIKPSFFIKELESLANS